MKHTINMRMNFSPLGKISKLIVICIACIGLFCNYTFSQNENTFGNGTIESDFPFKYTSSESRTQIIIQASELINAGIIPGEFITEVKFHSANQYSHPWCGFDARIGLISSDYFSDNNFLSVTNSFDSYRLDESGLSIEGNLLWDGAKSLLIDIYLNDQFYLFTSCNDYENFYSSATVFASTTNQPLMLTTNFDDCEFTEDYSTVFTGDHSYIRPNITVKTSFKGVQSNVIVGDINTDLHSSSLGPSPFGCNELSKTEILIKADELYASGLSPGIISEVSFFAVNGGYTSNPPYVRINIKNDERQTLNHFEDYDSEENTFYDFYVGSLPVVISNTTVSFTNSNSTFSWDGISNLLIQLFSEGYDLECYSWCGGSCSQEIDNCPTIKYNSTTETLVWRSAAQCSTWVEDGEHCAYDCDDFDFGSGADSRPVIQIKGAFDPDRQKLIDLAQAIEADIALEWDLSKNSSFWPNITKNSAGYVTHIDFSNLGLTGTIPPVIGEFTQLQSFNISGNDFWGDLPAEIFQVPTLSELNASDNNFTSIPDITTSTSTINVSNNRLDFEDILPNINTTAVFTYAPQKELIVGTEYWVDECSAFSISLPITDNPNNTYHWYQNGAPVSTDMVYTDPDIILRSEDGIYYCEMSNAEIDATGQTLLLRTMDITVNVNSSPLVSLYYAAGGDNWSNTTNNTDKWLQNADYESWYGVDLDEYGNVIRISLPGNNLNGSIHPEIEQLSFLQELDLSDNPNLYGDIPPEIYQLTELRILNLNACNISGSLTDDISFLFNLEELKLSGNSGMAGNTLPVGLDACHSLREVDVSYIGLNGSIPFNPTDHSSLQVLLLQNNNFEQLEDLSSISSLTDLWVANNKLTFDDLQPNFEFKFNDDLARYCPQQVINEHQNVDGLAEGLIEYNPYTYPVNEIGANGGNRYQWYHGGSLFGDVQTQGDLYIPVLHKTEHEGEYRLHVTNIGLEVNDEYCEILYNPFSINNIQSNPTGICSADRAALEAIYYATDGEYWDYDANWTTDASPWYNVTVVDGRVTGLDLSGNNLTQALPDELGDLTALFELDLSNNPGLGGSAIPQTVANLSQLQVLNLSGNNHSGAIPSGINALTNLREIRLNDNPSMGGFINTSYDDLAQLEILDFSNMDLSGTLPDELFDIATLRELKLSNNDFTGPLPEAISTATDLEVLDVSNNGLSGAVPASLSSLVNMTEINLSGNYFNDLPDLSGISGLELSVADNYFNFGDLIQNVTTFQSVNDYSPQKTIPLPDNEVSFNFCETGLYAYTGIIDANGALYRWYTNDGTPVSDAVASSDIDFYDGGEYYCHVTNEAALSGLTLIYGPLQVNANITIGDVDCDGQVLAFDGSMVLHRYNDLSTTDWGILYPWESWRDDAAQAEDNPDLNPMDVSAILKYVIRDVYELPVHIDTKSGSKELVSIVFDGEYIQLLSNGGLLGFGLEIPEGGKGLIGAPEVLAEDILYSQNISDSAYKAALATAHELPSGKPFMRIPVKSHSGSVRLMMDVNNLQQTETVDLQHTSIISSDGNAEMMCYPNPFSDKVVFVPAESNTGGQLRIYDAAGKMLQLLQPAEGNHGVQFQWDGYTSAGMKVLPGLYFYTYTTNLKVISGKLIYSK